MRELSKLLAATVSLTVLVLFVAAVPAVLHHQAPRLAEANPSLFFEDDFNGTAIDTSKWAASTNGYPDPAISVSGGFVQMGQPGTNSLDFPYVTSAFDPFPATGSFEIEVVAQYTTTTGSSGDGLLLLGPGASRLLQIWPGSGVLYGVGFGIPDPTSLHSYRLIISGGTASLSIDGVNTVSAPADVIPTSIWFGHPTVGQILFKDEATYHPGWVDPTTGQVLIRWWGNGEWTTFRIDSIRVTAIDSDGDGCTNDQELGPNPQLGGQRDPKNPWDYFNPTGDRQNRIDDVLAVAQHYGKNAGDPGYDTKYDRTYLGPNPWNLGPPDGMIRIQDVLEILHQYHHDCA